MQPNVSSKVRITSTGIAEPPETQVRSDGGVACRRIAGG